jgi:hypothetical protein
MAFLLIITVEDEKSLCSSLSSVIKFLLPFILPPTYSLVAMKPFLLPSLHHLYKQNFCPFFLHYGLLTDFHFEHIEKGEILIFSFLVSHNSSNKKDELGIERCDRRSRIRFHCLISFDKGFKAH